MAYWGIALCHGPHINNPVMSPERSQAANEALINTITQQLQTAASLESVLEITAREVGQALGAQRVTARLAGPPAAPHQPEAV